MFQRLLILFITIPLVEILILIKMGEIFGFWTTVGLVIGTGVLGAYLAKLHGLTIWFDIQRDLNMGVMPTDKMLDGLLVLVGGVVLLTPGLLTDIAGFLLLIPASRTVIKTWVRDRMARYSDSSSRRIYPDE